MTYFQNHNKAVKITSTLETNSQHRHQYTDNDQIDTIIKESLSEHF